MVQREVIDWNAVAGVSAAVSVAFTIAAAIWRETFGRALRWIGHGLTYLDPLRGIKAHLLRQDEKLDEIGKELKSNGGSSLKDQITRVEARQGIEAARTAMLLNESTALFWMSDTNGRQLEASRALVAMTGRRQEELLGWGWINVIHPDDRDRIRKCWMECIAEERNFDERCKFQTLGDAYYEGRLMAVPFRLAGKVSAWIGRATVEGPAVRTAPPKRPRAKRPTTAHAN